MHKNKNVLKVVLPEDISPVDHPPIKNLWAELRIKKNICSRSYHSSVIYNSTLYVYGGYDTNEGILNDFYSLNLSSEDGYEFVSESQKGQYPGNLHRHSAIVKEKYMYIFGGKQSIFENSQKLFRFDFQEKNWELLVYNENNVTLPSLDSHSVVVNDSEMIVFGGFKGGKIGKYSRSIYSYTFKTNEWRILYDNLDRNVSKNMIPKKRSSAGMVLNNSCLYVFGGVNNKFKFDDFWKFDLTDNNWKCLNPIGGNPLARSGHVTTCYKNCLLLFGGIHDLAHEKNDLHCYNFDKNEWIKIDSDFIETINIQEKLTLKGGYDNKVKALITQKTDNNSMPLKKPFLTPKNKHPFSIKLSKSPKNKKVSIVAEFALKKVKSPSKIKEERLKHDIHEKKNRLLAEFEISDEEKRKQLVQSPTTETMKKSINSMKFNFKFTSIQKNISIGIKESVIMTGYIIKDRKPCARDGCSASNFDNKLVIFGGDRHHMSLSDLYWLDLDKATKISLI